MAARNTGARPFSAHACYRTCIYRGLFCSYALMLAPAKPRIGRGWDLVSLICCSKTHRMAARKVGALSISASALALHHAWHCMPWVQGVCSDERMLAPANARIRREWDLISRIGRIRTHQMAARKVGGLSISAHALAMQCACQEGIQFSNQSSDAWRSGCVLQSIHTCFSQHPDVMQASTDLICNSTLIFNRVNPSSPQHSWQAAAKPNHGWKLKLGWVIDYDLANTFH